MLIILVFGSCSIMATFMGPILVLMKYLLCVLLLIFTGLTVDAQLEKGRHFLGAQTTLVNGDIYYTHLAISPGYPEKEYGMNLIPTYGWAAARNWLIGAQATLGYSTVETTYAYSTGDIKSVTNYYDMGLAPFTRLYLDVAAKGRFKLFGMAAVEIATVKSVGPNSSTGANTNVVGTIGGGLSYFTKKDLSIDMNICAAGIRFGVYKAFGGNKTKK
jgi:hypothetical protein